VPNQNQIVVMELIVGKALGYWSGKRWYKLTVNVRGFPMRVPVEDDCLKGWEPLEGVEA